MSVVYFMKLVSLIFLTVKLKNSRNETISFTYLENITAAIYDVHNDIYCGDCHSLIAFSRLFVCLFLNQEFYITPF